MKVMPPKGARNFGMLIFPHIKMVCIYPYNFINISEKNEINRTFPGKKGINMNRSEK